MKVSLRSAADAVCFGLLMLIFVGGPLYVFAEALINAIVDAYHGPYARILAWAVLASPIVWYAHERARMINHNNRGRYDGGIDSHKPPQ